MKRRWIIAAVCGLGVAAGWWLLAPGREEREALELIERLAGMVGSAQAEAFLEQADLGGAGLVLRLNQVTRRFPPGGREQLLVTARELLGRVPGGRVRLTRSEVELGRGGATASVRLNGFWEGAGGGRQPVGGRVGLVRRDGVWRVGSVSVETGGGAVRQMMFPDGP